MTKYIIQIGLETDLDLFPLEDKLTDMFLAEIMEGTFRNHVSIKHTVYEKIVDKVDELEGVNHGSAGSFSVIDDTEPFQKVTE